ncbi:hypothetical protein HQ950_06540 [Enterococcus faecium]|nr:hypothetical protein [Enterococcus faecium]
MPQVLKTGSKKADLSLAVSSFDSSISGRIKKVFSFLNKKETLGITLFFPSISFLIFCLFSKFFATKKKEYLYEISMKLIELHALF